MVTNEVLFLDKFVYSRHFLGTRFVNLQMIDRVFSHNLYMNNEEAGREIFNV